MLKLKNIKKSYRTYDFTQIALNDVSIAFRDNEFAAVLGTSGSGKTTMLNIIGGLDQYDAGEIEIDGISTKEYKSTDWDAYRNNRIGFVFQSYNLIPHQTVLANVELALTLSGVSKSERKTRALKALEDVGLKEHYRKLPSQLSGGQMQRVAIARALINDPEIVLADEPTGALDSATSEQVMELLSDIAKDRLVIMVTHNPDLADAYANRIIELKDGVIIGDSNPVSLSELETVKGKKPKEVGMSFFTAISLSLSNLMTKKGRTFVTALAGSIGIIGIAAILALASGINAYIAGIEEETMTNYPLTIQASGIDISSFISDPNVMHRPNNLDEEDTVGVRNVFDSMFNYQNKNDLASLKRYIEANDRKIGPYVKNIQYSYDITPQIYLRNSESIDQVSPDAIMKEFGFGPPEGMAAIMGGMSSGGMNNFFELPGELSLYENQYDLKVGRWPSRYDEAVVVLMPDGTVTDYTLYSLGLKDRSELQEMLNSFVNNPKETVDREDVTDTYPIEKLLEAKLSVIDSYKKYTYDSEYKVWLDKSDSKTHMQDVIDKSIDLKVVGVVQANGETTASMLGAGIYYTPELIHQLISNAKDADIIKQQLMNPEINVFTNKSFVSENEGKESDFDFANMFAIDEKAMKKAFKVDTSKFNFTMPDLKFDITDIQFPSFDLESISKDLGEIVGVPKEVLNTLITEITEDFMNDQIANGITDPNQMLENLPSYLQREDVRNKISDALGTVGQDITKIVENYISTMVQGSVDVLMTTLQNEIQSQLMASMKTLPMQLQNAMTFNQEAFMSAFKLKVSEEDIVDLITTMMSVSQSNLESNLKTLGYGDERDPLQISIYPKDFTTKESVIAFLNEYNNRMLLEDEEKVVQYSDLVGTLMSSVTDIVDTISYALIAFVAISLVVSSIMIGVITYVSVLERKKEIGILRAIGASKRDIRLVFNAETLIIGFIAGTIGIAVTYVIAFIGSVIVYNILGIANIAQLPIRAALILIGISMGLALISGLFPSSAAANKDPVEALRSE